MTNSHNHPVRIENFLRDLNLGTPELLKGTFEPHTPAQASLIRQPLSLKNTTAAQLGMARITMRGIDR